MKKFQLLKTVALKMINEPSNSNPPNYNKNLTRLPMETNFIKSLVPGTFLSASVMKLPFLSEEDLEKNKLAIWCNNWLHKGFVCKQCLAGCDECHPFLSFSGPCQVPTPTHFGPKSLLELRFYNISNCYRRLGPLVVKDPLCMAQVNVGRFTNICLMFKDSSGEQAEVFPYRSIAMMLMEFAVFALMVEYIRDGHINKEHLATVIRMYKKVYPFNSINTLPVLPICYR